MVIVNSTEYSTLGFSKLEMGMANRACQLDNLSMHI